MELKKKHPQPVTPTATSVCCSKCPLACIQGFTNCTRGDTQDAKGVTVLGDLIQDDRDLRCCVTVLSEERAILSEPSENEA